MKRQESRENIQRPFKNRRGFGTVNLLIVMAVILTITVGISSMASLATKSAQERKEETLALVQGQNIFAYADIALVEELQNIFEQERAKQEQTDANVNEAEENEDRDAEPEDGGIEGEPEEAQPLDTKEIAIKIYKLAGSKKIKREVYSMKTQNPLQQIFHFLF